MSRTSTSKTFPSVALALFVALLVFALPSPAHAANVAGVDWTTQVPPVENEWYSIAYGNGIFVAVGESRSGSSTDNIMTSSDGVTWTAQVSPMIVTWNGITFGNGT